MELVSGLKDGRLAGTDDVHWFESHQSVIKMETFRSLNPDSSEIKDGPGKSCLLAALF